MVCRVGPDVSDVGGDGGLDRPFVGPTMSCRTRLAGDLEMVLAYTFLSLRRMCVPPARPAPGTAALAGGTGDSARLELAARTQGRGVPREVRPLNTCEASKASDERGPDRGHGLNLFDVSESQTRPADTLNGFATASRDVAASSQS